MKKKEIYFILLFIFFFILCQVIHHGLRNNFSPQLLYKLNAGVSASIIRLVMPKSNITVTGNTIITNDFKMRIDQGCEGVEGIILITSAICAFPLAGLLAKFFGIIVGILFMYIANVIRITGLFFVVNYFPDFFDIMHVYVGQTFIIFSGILFFISWINRVHKDNAKDV